MKKIIVVTGGWGGGGGGGGGGGFVGSNLIEYLIKTKYQIVCLDNYSSGSKKSIER